MQDPNDLKVKFEGAIPEKDRPTSQNKDSFSEGYKTFTLKKGLVLHRFISGPGSRSFSDCWIDEPTFTSMIRQLQNAYDLVTGLADQLEVSDKWKRNQMLDQLGVLGSWSKFTRRVKITLKQDVIAHVGVIAPQYVYVDAGDGSPGFRGKRGHGGTEAGTTKKRVEVRHGGHTQYVIPRFTDPKLDQEENEYAKVDVNTDIFRRKRGR